MTIWYAVAALKCGPLTDDQLADATQALPGYATLNHDATLAELQVRFQIEGDVFAYAVEAASNAVQGILRDLGAEPRWLNVAAEESALKTLRQQLAGQLVGATEGAAMLGVSRARFNALANNPPPGWPGPIPGKVGASDVYLRGDLAAFNNTWTRERTGRTPQDMVSASQRTYDAARAALASAGLEPGEGSVVTFGTGHRVLLRLLSPNLGSPSAETAVGALAGAGIVLKTSAPQDKRDLTRLLGEGEPVELFSVR